MSRTVRKKVWKLFGWDLVNGKTVRAGQIAKTKRIVRAKPVSHVKAKNILCVQANDAVNPDFIEEIGE